MVRALRRTDFFYPRELAPGRSIAQLRVQSRPRPVRGTFPLPQSEPISNFRTWAKDHRKGLMIAGIGVALAGVFAWSMRKNQELDQ